MNAKYLNGWLLVSLLVAVAVLDKSCVRLAELR
jgi:hypothetical protein